jgi:cyclophilin family peptidyl-prolyl cis-trans isomerase
MVMIKRQSFPEPAIRRGSELPMGDDDSFTSCSSRRSSSSSLSSVALHLPMISPPSKRRSRRTFAESSTSLPNWVLPLCYLMVVVSWYKAVQQKGVLTEAMMGVEYQRDQLKLQQEENIRLLEQARETKNQLERKKRKLERTHDALLHERRMNEEVYEMKVSSDPEISRILSTKRSGTVTTWIQQRQQGLRHKIETLQSYIQDQSRKQILKKYGPGPHKVQFTVQRPSYREETFVVQMADIDSMPHSVLTFLDMISLGLWDNTMFYYHDSTSHVLAAAPVAYGTYEPKSHHFEALGFKGNIFAEYNDNYAHEPYAIGFSGRGPNFYININDNTKQHGPGGQSNRDLPGEADPCFGKIVSGVKVVKKMVKTSKNFLFKKSAPETWEDYSTTRIVRVQLMT